MAPMILQVLPTAWGVRNASPFNLKAQALLELSGLPHETVEALPQKGPRGKLPALRDGDRVIPDSSHIQRYLETRYGIDFDGALSPAQEADAEAYRRMAEEYLYFAVLHHRWLVEPHVTREAFFGNLPWGIRHLVFYLLQRQVRRTLWGQGLARHTRPEINDFAIGMLRAIEGKLGDSPYLLGDRLTSVDLAVYPQLVNVIDPPYDSPMAAYGRASDTLGAYCRRCESQVFGTTVVERAPAPVGLAPAEA